jgi:hypothetical protein
LELEKQNFKMIIQKLKIKKNNLIFIICLSFFIFFFGSLAAQAADPEIPKIISREDWQADESSRLWRLAG